MTQGLKLKSIDKQAPDDQSGRGPGTFLIVSGILTGALSAIRILRELPAAAASGNPVEYQQAVTDAIITALIPIAVFALCFLCALPNMLRLRALRKRFPSARVFTAGATTLLRERLNSVELFGPGAFPVTRGFWFTVVGDTNGVSFWIGLFRPRVARHFPWADIETVASRNTTVGPRRLWMIALTVRSLAGNVDLELTASSEAFAGFFPQGQKGVAKLATQIDSMRPVATGAE